MKKFLRKNSYAILVGFLLFILVASIVWAGTPGGGDNPSNPFGSSYDFQGFSLLHVIYPDGDDDYWVYSIWGVDPTDCKGSLYLNYPGTSQQYISTKLKAFLDANEVYYDSTSGQYNLWPVYTYNSFPFILTAGVQGNGNFAMVNPQPNGAIYLSKQQVKYYWDNGTWLINASAFIPETGEAKAPGWATTFTFIPPDLQATSVNSGVPADGARQGNTYYASAKFYMNYKMAGYSYIRLYQFKSDNTATLLKENFVYFGRFGGAQLDSVPWTMDNKTTKIVAAVAMKWDNNTKSWVKDTYSNPYISLSGDKTDNN